MGILNYAIIVVEIVINAQINLIKNPRSGILQKTSSAEGEMHREKAKTKTILKLGHQIVEYL